jgi:hypothetical protein
LSYEDKNVRLLIRKCQELAESLSKRLFLANPEEEKRFVFIRFGTFFGNVLHFCVLEKKRSERENKNNKNKKIKVTSEMARKEKLSWKSSTLSPSR